MPRIVHSARGNWMPSLRCNDTDCTGAGLWLSAGKTGSNVSRPI